MRLEIRGVGDGHEHLGVTSIYMAFEATGMDELASRVRRGEESLDRGGVHGGASEVGEKTGERVLPGSREETFYRRKKSISAGTPAERSGQMEPGWNQPMWSTCCVPSAGHRGLGITSLTPHINSVR